MYEDGQMRRVLVTDLDSVELGGAIQTPRPRQLGMVDEGQTRKRMRRHSTKSAHFGEPYTGGRAM
jgi:hypothetical protein